MNKLLKYSKFILNEFLKNTLQIDTAMDHIRTDIYLINNNNLKMGDFSIEVKGDKMLLEFKNNYDKEQIELIFSSIFSTGYVICKYIIMDNFMSNELYSDEEFLKYWIKKQKKYKKEITNFQLICEPLWDEIVSIGDKLYHVTEQKNTENVLKYGLLPISGKKKSYHPERVYLSKTINGANRILKTFKNIDKLNKIIKNYDLLEINTNNLKSIGFDGKEYDVVFYKDPNYIDGVYTFDRINSINISIININI